MKLNYYLTFTLCLPFFSVYSQSYTARLVDSITQKPIAFATVQTSDRKGVISNDDGYFTLNLEAADSKTITISCMGYTTKVYDAARLSTNAVILLSEKINELETVYVNTEKPNIDSIIKRVNQNLSKNYKHDNTQFSVFHRSTNNMDFDRLDFDIDKASGIRKTKLKEANKSLDSLANTVKNSKIVSFKDFAGEYYLATAKKPKFKALKATLLVDKAKDFSLENVEQKGKTLILKYLDTTKTYKLKSGLFKVEDSLSLADEMQKEQENKHEFNIDNLKSEVSSLLHKTFFNPESFMHNLVNPDWYTFSLEDITYYQNELVYVVHFSPKKSKAKYSGTLYISDVDYGVLRADYQFAKGKRGQKFNVRLLLGIKYIENHKKGIVLFNKDTLYQYKPKYIFEEQGRYIYVHRPLKFKENSPEKNKVAFDFLLEGNVYDKSELLIMDTQTLTSQQFDAVKEEKTIPYQYLKAYNPDLWKEFNAIEPLEEMKQFKSVE